MGSLQYSFDENNDTKALEAGLPASAALVPGYVAGTLQRRRSADSWRLSALLCQWLRLPSAAGYIRTSTLPGGTDVDALDSGRFCTAPAFGTSALANGLNKAENTLR